MPEKTNAKTNATTQAIQVLPPLPESADFPLLEDPGSVIALFDERLADGGGLPVLDLPRIRVASGGALAFRYETAGGEEMAKKLEGVLVAYRSARVYWKSRAAGKKPPDCSSIDGFVGTGDPGGECSKCPYARFGSGLRADGSPSNGQACKDVRQVLFLLKGELLPHLLSVPPTSVKAFGQYTLTLMSARARYWGAITELTLEKAQSDEQIDYAKIVFRLNKRLDEKDLRPLEAFHGRMKGVLKPAIIDAGMYEVLEEGSVPAPRRLPQNATIIPGPGEPTIHTQEDPSGRQLTFGDDDVPF